MEHTEKCPVGFIPISRTHDQDQDADLWREHSLFMRKPGRYLCLSKTEGLPNHVIQEIAVVGDKDLPPEGYSLLHRTADTEQKAWRKRQLVYRLTHVKNATQAITDIIVCSRLKQAPAGFTFAGEINGMTVCYKMGSIGLNNILNGQSTNGSPFLNNRAPPERPPRNPQLNKSPQISYPNLEHAEGDHDYERLIPSYLQPSRPAPNPPAVLNGFSTLAAYNAIDGVPFVLHPKLVQNKDDIANKVSKQNATSCPFAH